jgi:UDP-glucose 4-epimerase
MNARDQKQVVVTGGAGFVGSHLVERLLLDGRRVLVVDDLSTGSLANLRGCAENPKFRIATAKVSQLPDLADEIANSQFVFHLAAAVGVEMVVNSPIRTIETNLEETRAVLAAASQSATPVLLASTSEVYGKSQKESFTEEDDLLIGPPTLGRWSYACSKLMDEFLAMAFLKERKLPVVVARLFNTVGPRQTGQYGMVLPRFIHAAQTGAPLRVYGSGGQTRCFCHVADTVEALIRLMNTPDAVGGIINIGSTEEISILDLATLVIQLLHSPSRVELVPYQDAYAPGFEDMLRRKPNVDKLANLTGFRPSRPLLEIIRALAQSH